MTTLRIRGGLQDAPDGIEWVLLEANGARQDGRGLAQVAPGIADIIELVLPAADVLLIRAKLPPGFETRDGGALAYAAEEMLACNPESVMVFPIHFPSMRNPDDAALGTALAVVDRAGLEQRLESLRMLRAGSIRVFVESLMVPIGADAWSMVWNGRDGFVRTAPDEGFSTDTGEAAIPPVALIQAIDKARRDGRAPGVIELWNSAHDAGPDPAAWRQRLGVDCTVHGQWDWKTAPLDASNAIHRERSRRFGVRTGDKRLRWAIWIAGATVAVHTAFLSIDWGLLARSETRIQREMESRFRSLFPDAVAVVDPSLQMRRKLAEMRREAGLPDPSEFVPMLGAVASALGSLGPENISSVAFEPGKLTLELKRADMAALNVMASRLRDAGFETDFAGGKPGSGTSTGPQPAVVVGIRVK